MNKGSKSLLENFQKYLRYRTVKGHAKKETHPYSRNQVESVPDPEVIPDLLSIQELVFPQPDIPIVSIIVPVYNQWKFTYNCLQSILSNTKEVAYEIIVADDCSTDQTHDMLKKIKGVIAIKNDTNLGFLKNCNNAAKYARGKYLLFLNNDTFVLNGCLEALLECAERNENAAIVGPNIIAPNGRLLENGWIIGTHGQGKPIGRGENPTAYQYNYVKEVDCVTGACFLILKEVFFDAGSFNMLYSPAYYEEFDMAFSVKKMGYKVMIQPKAMLIHYGNSSYGINTAIELSIINSQKFKKRWNIELQKRSADFTNKFLMRDGSIERKVLLIIDNSVPQYEQDDESFMIYQYSQLFQEKGLKMIFFPDNLEKLEPYTHEMQQAGIEVIYGKFNFDLWIKENGRYLDLVCFSSPEISLKYIDKINRHSKATILFCIHELQYMRHLRQSGIHNKQSLKMSRKLKKIEYRIFNKADILLTFSDFEANIILHDLPHKRVEVIPLFAYDTFPDSSALPSFEERKNIIFLGDFKHTLNVDAVRWFVKECFPSVFSQIKDIKFTIVGSNPPQMIKDLASDNIEVACQVQDLPSYIQNVRVFVAPLRLVGGFKGKLITSMYCGVPVITTPTGAEGLGLIDGENALVADNKDAFISKIVELYTNKSLWENLSVNCSNYARRTFSKQRAWERMRDILGSIAVLIP
jgi:GT2 family glycosyltransferase/glycosyltransferase involved in cell wall biosynthesis